MQPSRAHITAKSSTYIYAAHESIYNSNKQHLYAAHESIYNSKKKHLYAAHESIYNINKQHLYAKLNSRTCPSINTVVEASPANSIEDRNGASLDSDGARFASSLMKCFEIE